MMDRVVTAKRARLRGAPAQAGLRDRMTAALAQRILDGTYPPGSLLPPEAALCAEFAVSRTVLREAIRVLDAKGFVAPRQRVGTTVRTAEEWSRLDPEVLGWMGAIAPDLDFIHGLIEARVTIEPKAAELAARRASARDLSAIEAAYERMRESHPHDLETCTAADLDFHIAILRATKNPVFAHLGSVIGAALSSSFRLTTSLTRSYERTLAVHGDVLESIRLRKPDAARQAMEALLLIACDDLAGIERDRFKHTFAPVARRRAEA